MTGPRDLEEHPALLLQQDLAVVEGARQTGQAEVLDQFVGRRSPAAAPAGSAPAPTGGRARSRCRPTSRPRDVPPVAFGPRAPSCAPLRRYRLAQPNRCPRTRPPGAPIHPGVTPPAYPRPRSARRPGDPMNLGLDRPRDRRIVVGGGGGRGRGPAGRRRRSSARVAARALNATPTQLGVGAGRAGRPLQGLLDHERPRRPSGRPPTRRPGSWRPACSPSCRPRPSSRTTPSSWPWPTPVSWRPVRPPRATSTSAAGHRAAADPAGRSARPLRTGSASARARAAAGLHGAECAGEQLASPRSVCSPRRGTW